MAKVLIFVFLIATAVVVMAAPAEEKYEVHPQDFEDQQVSEVGHQPGQLRLPRATCDLLSGLGVGDSACAAHCLARKYAGGWCEKGVCHCRR